ncbi:MAG: hypothetical protein KDH90_17080, partial [Anaerolineae bacterium]|nr:hypothetical protein [Anaerolineae bacterium]
TGAARPIILGTQIVPFRPGTQEWISSAAAVASHQPATLWQPSGRLLVSVNVVRFQLAGL